MYLTLVEELFLFEKIVSTCQCRLFKIFLIGQWSHDKPLMEKKFTFLFGVVLFSKKKSISGPFYPESL